MSASSLVRHPQTDLDARLRQVGRRSERLQLCYGISCFLSTVLLAGFACGLADYVARSQESGWRWALSTLFCAVAAVAFAKFVQPVLGFQRSNLTVARRIEDRFPQLRDKLSSAVSFLQGLSSGPLGGSPELQRAVIADAAAELEPLDLMDCLDDSRPRRAAVGTLVTLALVATICYANPVESFQAARRLLLPWRPDLWPRWNTLSFQSPPRKLAAGADFEAELIDLAGHLPDEVTIQYWFAGEPLERVVSRAMKRVAGRMVDRQANVDRSFQVRAFGGDDDTMPWLRVDVVQPPRVEELRIDVTPPTYSRRPPRQSGRNIRALQGSAISLWARANKPISSIEATATFAEQHWQVQPQLAADRLSFAIPGEGPPLIAAESGEFRIVLLDDDGIGSSEELTCTLEVLPDLPPVVAIDAPPERAYFTRSARVPLEAVVSDDIGIAGVALQFRGQTMELAAPAATTPATADAVDTRRVQHEWELEAIPNLTVGDVLEFELLARDERPQTGTSGVRRLSIVSETDLLARLAERANRIRGSIGESLEAQRAVRSNLTRLAPDAAEVSQWKREQVDALESIALGQHHVKQLISADREGLADRIGRLLQDAASNQLQQQLQVDELHALLEDLQETGSRFVAPAEEQLARAARAARGAAADSGAAEELDELLAAAGLLQDRAIAELERIVQSLTEWEDVQQVAALLASLRRRQAELSAATQSATTIGREPSDLTAEERQELQELAGRQRELAEQLNQMLGGISSLAHRTSESQPVVAEALQAALRLARSQAVGGLLGEAARSIERNRIGRAAQHQSKVEQTLESISGIVDAAVARPAETAARQTELQSALRESLVELRAEQIELAAETARTASRNATRDPGAVPTTATKQLAGRQRTLRDEVLQLATKAAPASLQFLLQRAGTEMNTAALRLAEDDAGEFAQRAQRDAARRLALAAFALEPPASRELANGPGSAAGQVGAEESTDRVDPVELRLLQALQVDINRRTEEFAAAGARPAREQLERLADEQEWLGRRVRELFGGLRSAAGEELP